MRIAITLIPFVVLAASVALATEPKNDVLSIAYAFKDGGGYNKQWKGSGTPVELRYAGKQILAKGNGTYCCGFTLAVAMKVAEKRGLLAGKSAQQVKAFQKQWYGVPKPSSETLCVYAVEQLGIGKRVAHKDAMPGDFVQLWRRSKSGHSVIFLRWALEDERQVGFWYRSSQGSTNGIGDRVEYFSDSPGKKGRVMRKRTYFCRLNPGKQASDEPGKGTSKEKARPD